MKLLLQCESGDQVHQECLRKYCAPNQIAKILKQTKVFAKESATPEEISIAGEQALVALYNGKPGESLDSLRYKLFCEKLPQTHLVYIHKPCHLLQLLQNTIAFEFIFKYWSGKVIVVK